LTSHPEPQDARASSNPFFVPPLRTERLLIRELEETDLNSCVDLFVDIAWNNPELTPEEDSAQRLGWLRWTIGGYRQFAQLYQPPLGERAIIHASTGEFLGLVGYVPSFEPFERLAAFGDNAKAGRTMELGLFWALHTKAQGKGYATEAAAALVEHAFTTLAVDRIIATTEHDNLASVEVMRRLGMQIEKYTKVHPGLQVVGLLTAPASINSDTSRAI
jgi:RimJ/RimL family protein N-acetyltransferase